MVRGLIMRGTRDKATNTESIVTITQEVVECSISHRFRAVGIFSDPSLTSEMLDGASTVFKSNHLGDY